MPKPKRRLKSKLKSRLKHRPKPKLRPKPASKRGPKPPPKPKPLLTPRRIPDIGPHPVFSLERLFTRQRLNQPGHALSHRLASVSWLMDYMLWETGDGQIKSYLHWRPEQRRRLDDLFNLLEQNQPTLDFDFPRWGRADSGDRPGGGPPRSVSVMLPAAQAFDLYAAHIAHVLLVEAQGLVPWTLGTMTDFQLAELFNSNRYHSRIVPCNLQNIRRYYPSNISPGFDYQLTNWAFAGGALLGDPRTGARFMRGETSTLRTNLVGATPTETMINLTMWAANNIFHGGAENTTSVFLNAHSQIQDRLRGIRPPEGEQPLIVGPWGCHSSANLLRDLARSVNIPLVCTNNLISNTIATHAGLVFTQEGSLGTPSRLRILPHGDNICAEYVVPMFPLDANGQVMNEAQKAQAFFDASWLDAQALANLGYVVPAAYDFDVVPPSDINDKPTLGIPGGSWDTAGMLAYSLEKNMRLGSWVNFLEVRCQEITRGNHQLRVNWDNYHNAQSTPFDAYSAAADACLSAYGGCDRLQRKFDQWLKRPTNVLRP